MEINETPMTKMDALECFWALEECGMLSKPFEKMVLSFCTPIKL